VGEIRRDRDQRSARATRWLTAHLRTLQPLLAQPPATVVRWPRAALIGDLGLGPFVPTIVRTAMLAPIGAWWLFAR
jgi:hypothetical protein